MNKVTVILAALATGLVSSAHLWMPLVPPQYAAIAGGVVAMVASIYHLYQSSPTDTAAKGLKGP